MEQDNNLNHNQESSTSTLESNIINIEIPEGTVTEENIVPIKEEKTVSNDIPTSQENSVMKETKIDDGTINSKGIVPVFIIFGFFLLLIIVFPYISDYLNKKAEEERNNIIVTPTPTVEAVVDTNDNFSELYDACGTSEVFTNISIDYTKKDNQCFKINLSNKKTFIKYVSTTDTNATWSIYLGDSEIYSQIQGRTISKASINNNLVVLEEVDALGNVTNTYNYDINGNLIG